VARAAQQLYAVTGRYDIIETGLLQIAACLFSRTFYVVLLVNYSNNHTPSTQNLLSAAITLFLIQQCTILNKLTPSTHTHTRLMALCPGLLGWAGTRKAKPIWILLKQETVSGSGISWAICKSAPSSRQTTTPAPHHSVFAGRVPFLPPNQQRQSTEGT